MIPEITLIVAATTRHMGIGKSGTLPWTGLKQEMAYFARVTKRVPEPEVGSPSSHLAVFALLFEVKGSARGGILDMEGW